MSFFVDDDAFQESTEFKCQSDERSGPSGRPSSAPCSYAVKRGVAPVAALGNSDQDLANPVDETGQPIDNECEVVPAETDGVIGTVALGNRSEKAGYSNYGTGRPMSPHPAATAPPATAGPRSCPRCPAAPTAASRARAWPRRTPRG